MEGYCQGLRVFVFFRLVAAFNGLEVVIYFGFYGGMVMILRLGGIM